MTHHFTAVVHAADGVRFVASAASRSALMDAVAGYVERRCDDLLWPDDAASVRALIVAGKVSAAVGAYFAKVGDRWDREELEVNAWFPEAAGVEVS